MLSLQLEQLSKKELLPVAEQRFFVQERSDEAAVPKAS